MATPPTFTVGQVLTAAQMNAVGMWKLGTITYTNTTSGTLDGVLTSDYDNYLITWEMTNTATNANNIFLRLRKNGTDSSTGYFNQWIYAVSGGSPLLANATNEAEWTIGYAGNRRASGTISLFMPQVSGTTAFTWQGGGTSNGGTGIIASGQGVHTVSDSYDGIKIRTTDNMTGKIVVYGYRK